MSRQHLQQAALAGALLGTLALPAGAGERDWIATWQASPQPLWAADFPFPTQTPFNLWRQTVRQMARVSLGGETVRVELSNAYGRAPLQIGAAHLALAGDGAAIVPGSDRTLRFGGQQGVTIPPGAPVLSDPVALSVPDLARLSVSLYLPQPTAPSTFHWEGLHSVWLAAGNRTADAALDDATALPVRLFVSGIQVRRADAAGAVVALGDSITDGAASTPGADRRWPDQLATRLAPQRVAVLNAGISGGRVLRDRMGRNALARLDRDVLAQPGVHTLVLLIGINDISWYATPFAPDDAPVSAQELIAGYRQLLQRAQARGLRVIGATLTPFERALPDTPIHGYHSANKEHVRQQVNAWIRDGNGFDAIIDFDALLRDPAHPTRMLPAFDSGDHLHPGDAGYAAMAEAAARVLGNAADTHRDAASPR
ncbi:SGNH/GDSL hydrolase family protein [Xanthomonas cerealis]|uniref:SGNH/GDSL hydrolase family protein n=1 Tax=Xanthomonas cerealis TaxID=3390025 RepID=UPI000578FC16|nr:SGNH/GDSL hydrolase family protein [Xanthomonas translucens]UKE46422.1 SGNH/GDSL hydrolase family protein [Xanthomonas translucens pv. cerealis]